MERDGVEGRMLGIIGGTSLLFSELPRLERETVDTPYGRSELLCGDVVMLLRHQGGLPPHRINYRSHLAALAIRGVERIVAIGSAGSLTPSLPPGSIVIPTDYLSVTDVPSIHDHAIAHVCPEIDGYLAGRLKELVPEARLGGCYVQTRGPRIETRAEVRALACAADVVGMTVASEATLARELDIPFAALCMVDNFAHGIGEGVLTFDHILEAARANSARTGAIVRAIVEGLG